MKYVTNTYLAREIPTLTVGFCAFAHEFARRTGKRIKELMGFIHKIPC